MAGLATAVAALEAAANALNEVEVHGETAQDLAATIETLERVDAKVVALRARVVAQVEADGVWTLGGARSMQGWVRSRTGRFASEAAALVRMARGLRDHLPRAAEALAAGEITADHAKVLVRHALGSEACKARLADAETGEEFLLEHARKLDASGFNLVVKRWAMYSDPEAAEATWREDAGRETFSFARTLDGWAGQIWLSEANGALVHEALQALEGSPQAGDLRSAGQRRAAALVEAAGMVLDSGKVQPSARIRPHLAVTADLATLEAVIAAQQRRQDPASSTPETFGADSPGTDADLHGPGTGASGEVIERIDVGLDLDALVGVEPARLGDGTPIPYGLFAQLVCEAGLYRVIFGAGSELLDVGREKRLFTAAQTRGILARDGRCRFPGCTAPPGVGEIHHALHFGAHGGKTDVRNGVLLCRYHHSVVHRLELAIERRERGWWFLRPDGSVYGITKAATDREPDRPFGGVLTSV